MNALVAGYGSYIVWPCGHDLHGPTKTKKIGHRRGEVGFPDAQMDPLRVGDVGNICVRASTMLGK